MKFGNLIRAARLNAEFSMTKAAGLFGVSVTFYSDVESGRKPPFPISSSYEKLAGDLGLDLKDLLVAATAERKEFDSMGEDAQLTAALVLVRAGGLNPGALEVIRREVGYG